MATVLSITELTGRLGRLIRRPDERCDRGEVIEKGDFCLDLRARRATVRGQQLQLTAEEFDMLVFLAGHPRRVVTPRTTLTTRWGEHEVRQADFLRVLSSLRQKMAGVEGGANYIRIEPWVFCRFEPGGAASSSS
ncbi:MAG TPA: winged helix-turn-helix domain-containing protein [Terriglobales bacterium]|nr:winged helix-turn-helix domain-containing protein [Terriglobales bacterium]